MTKRGREKTRVPSPDREPVLDFLYENKTATYDQLVAVVGRESLSRTLNNYIRLGLVEEVADGSF